MQANDVYFYDPAEFEWVALLEKEWQLVRAELEAIIEQTRHSIPVNWTAAHPAYVQSDYTQGASWKTFEFMFFGIRNRQNCARCPHTTRLLQQIPELVTAQFSMLEPHTHIKPHKGYSRMVLRNHLALIVPEPELCALRIETETRHWQEGAVMVFDDSFEHEAWNKSDKRRAVLMFDIANKAWGYTAEQICRYKLKTTQDPFLLNIAPNETWLQWFEAGYFPDNLLSVSN